MLPAGAQLGSRALAHSQPPSSRPHSRVTRARKALSCEEGDRLAREQNLHSSLDLAAFLTSFGESFIIFLSLDFPICKMEQL